MVLFWNYLSGFSILLPLAVWLLRFGFKSAPAPGLFFFLLLFSGVELAGVLLALQHKNNIWLACLFIPFEVGLLLHTLAQWMHRPMSVVTFAAVLLATLFSLTDALFICQLKGFNAFSRLGTSVLMLVGALIAFYDLLEGLREESLSRSPLFWMATAMLLYYSGTLTLFVVKSYDPLRLGSHVAQMWLLHSALNISFNLLLVKVMLCLPSTVTKSS